MGMSVLHALAMILIAAWTLPHYNAQLNPVLAGPDIAGTWTFQMGEGTSTVPTVDGHTVFLASNDNNVYALDLRTGTLEWKAETGDDVMTAPLAYKGVVIVGTGNSTSSVWDPPKHIIVGTGDNEIIGLRERDGKRLWTHHLAGTGMPSGAIVGNLYVHHDGAGNIIALDPHSGKLIWRKNVRSVAAMSAIAPAANGLLLTAGVAPPEILAVHQQNGKIAWTHKLPPSSSGTADTPIATDGAAYAATMYLLPDDPKRTYTYTDVAVTQHVIAIDAKTGTTRWDVPIEQAVLHTKNWASIPVLAHGRLYIGSELTPYMHALDASNGRELWRAKVDGLVQSGSVYKDGILYFGDSSGILWALDAANGAVIGSKRFSDGFRVGSPIIVGKMLIIGGNNGAVYSVPLASITSSHDA
jgi:outer membrane protein assembly factor BamB